MKRIALFIALLTVFAACQKNELLVVRDDASDLEEMMHMETALRIFPASYKVDIPEYLKAVGMQNPVFDDAKVVLGRVLFYDKKLSRDGSTSCASCHKQERAFSDDVAFSKGIHGQLSKRNAMPLANVSSFAGHYAAINGQTPLLLWDERASTVAEQARIAITNPMEMDMSILEVVSRIKEQNYYPYLWKQAYGNFEVSETKLLECLNEFVGAITSFNSKFDRALTQSAGQFGVLDTVVRNIYYGPTDTVVLPTLPFYNLSEFMGLQLFVDNCSKCHSPIRPFQEVFIACNGLDMQYSDTGLGAITGRAEDEGFFKSPSLRNIALTAPYMHDGRFKTLQEVIEFYSTGVQDHPNLHPDMPRSAKGSTKLNFTEKEKSDLLAFLNTLTDPSVKYDIRFSNPFK